MDTVNNNSNENKTAQDIVNSMSNDNNAAMEKNMKFAFIFAIITLVAALAGVAYGTILLIYVVVLCVKALKIEEYKSQATKTLIIALLAFVITIIRLIA